MIQAYVLGVFALLAVAAQSESSSFQQNSAPPAAPAPAKNVPAEAERVFNALAEDGKVQMPLQQTFWTVRFGMLIDRFGIPWMINCEQAA